MGNRKFKKMDNLVSHIVRMSVSDDVYFAAKDLIKKLDTNDEQRAWYYSELLRLYSKDTNITARALTTVLENSLYPDRKRKLSD